MKTKPSYSKLMLGFFCIAWASPQASVTINTGMWVLGAGIWGWAQQHVADRFALRRKTVPESRGNGSDAATTSYSSTVSSGSEGSEAVGSSSRDRPDDEVDSTEKFPREAHPTKTPSSSALSIRCVTWNLGDTTPLFIAPELLGLAEPEGSEHWTIKAGWANAGEEEQTPPATLSASPAATQAMEGSQREDSCSCCGEAGHAFQECRATCAAADVVRGSPAALQSDSPPTQKLTTKLPEASNIPHPDVLAIAVQEAEEVSQWEQLLKKHVGPHYTRVAADNLWGIHLVVFIRSTLRGRVTDVQTSSMPVGIGKVLGNKGAVAVSMQVDGATRLLFVNSHLAAHQKNVKRRNVDSARIRVASEKPTAPAPKIHPESVLNTIDRVDSNSSTESSAEEKPKGSLCIAKRLVSLFRCTRDITAKHHVTIWCGDLNYRINGSKQDVEQAVKNGNLEALRDLDQLTRERQEGRVFQEFEEGPINFPPTFKLDRESNTYDTSKKQRVPSWTDRILYRIMSPSASGAPPVLEQVLYDSVRDMRSSDHRPVFSDFILTPAEPTPVLKKKRGKVARRFLGPLHRLRVAFCAVA